jgi:hypothetical protein
MHITIYHNIIEKNVINKVFFEFIQTISCKFYNSDRSKLWHRRRRIYLQIELASNSNLENLQRLAKLYKITIFLDTVLKGNTHGCKRPYTEKYTDLHCSVLRSFISELYTGKYDDYREMHCTHGRLRAYMNFVFGDLGYFYILYPSL